MDLTTRIVEIARITAEALDVLTFELVDPTGSALPAFTAGAHIDLRLDNGIVRQYSLSNSPGETHRYEIAVLKTTDSRGGSVAMHDLKVGQKIRISDPRNHFSLVESARRSLLFAGGIGVTPILCMAEHLASAGASFEMHYCTRSAARTAFADRMRQSAFAKAVHFHHDDGRPEEKLDIAAVVATPKADTHLYVCGPQPFIDWVLDAARDAGWPEERLHREYFTAAPVELHGDKEMGFEVEIASTGAVLAVATDQTVLSVLSAAGIDIPSSCENGVCGTCITGIRGGIPDHRDMYLTPEEREKGDQFTPCCSRSKSARLVLNL